MKCVNIFLSTLLFFAMVFILSCAGNDGEDGASCIAEPKANAEDGFDILCEGEKIGEISNGKTECFLEHQTDGRVYVICNNEKIGELSNGIDGEQGELGEKGEQGEQGEHGADCDVEEEGPYYVVKCGEYEKARLPKATCGTNAYDPAEMTCSKNILSFNFTDTRDNAKYKAVVIGTQTWMAENLNYAGNEDDFFYSTCYDDCVKYGRLYNWETATTVCPADWHLPSDDEWTALIDFVGGNDIAGLKLKAKTGWEDYDQNLNTSVYINSEIGNVNIYIDKLLSGNGTDDYGFSALPGGVGIYVYNGPNSAIISYIYTLGIDIFSSWWTSTDNVDATSVAMFYMSNSIEISNKYNKINRLYVRCVKDIPYSQPLGVSL